MKSIADFMDESNGTGPAVGKQFQLYGMPIGEFKGMFLQTNTLIFSRDGCTMEVPVMTKLSIPIAGISPEAKISNPVLQDIILSE
ncbi:hypothetical protein [Serratia sp. P2ACOL2]|uniref:hypothetical protein n=1 Tax=Serratia sp. P2ACOL2 TaxID=2482769 RepID=UPI000EFC8343|nr:hypothetical protein [Serratia sp. P2ACOL2]AYO37215.1 hypothetical protein EBA31_07850 [Serratia sp. P2ACOL2]